MIGTIRWNIVIGGFSFIFTFMLSFANNVFSTALVRSFLSGLILFFIIFLFRWIMGTIIFPSSIIENDMGKKIDFVTPDESIEIHQLMRTDSETAADEPSFAPLNPPKLVSKHNMDPEEMVKALRHMSED
ncbi:MAG: hypothetical protein JWM44_114 [Bacilli bacterium]|nr:hypothetical protein [Bacilli bacterium]